MSRDGALNAEFSAIFTRHDGKLADKWSSYLPIYDRALIGYRNKPVSLLEIGIQNGGSLEIWSKYFSHAKKIVGCDIDENCRDLRFENEEISVVIGAINLDETFTAINNLCADFDIIIDDGSHRSDDVIASFLKYFPMLKDEGLYIVEDLHTSYWRSYKGSLRRRKASMEFFKSLVDVINFEHWEGQSSPATHMRDFARYADGGISNKDLAHVHHVSFFNSMCIIEKRLPEHNRLGLRKIPGDELPVTINSKARGDQEISPSERAGTPSLTSRIRTKISLILGKS